MTPTKKKTTKSEDGQTTTPNPRLSKKKLGFRSATVAILGRPNAGKSTLLNALLDVAVSATSDRPQTTRTNVKGIIQLKDKKNGWNGQLVLVDTPGINFKKGLLERSMHMAVEGALEGVDIAVWVADGRTFDKDLGDIAQKKPGADKIAGWLRETLVKAAKPAEKGEQKTRWVLAINKADLMSKPDLLPLIERAATDTPQFEQIIPIAAAKGIQNKDSNLDSLMNVLESLAPEGAALYPEDSWTDLNERQLLQNLVREAVFRQSRKEVPYQTDCSIIQFIEPTGKQKRPEADVAIWVSRPSLKPIMVGAKGSRIRDIGVYARERFKEITGDDLILRLHVKVVEKWDTRTALLQELGYAVE